MSISRAFAYTSSVATPYGATQIGNLLIQSTGWTAETGGVKWWNGPDESIGYVIAYEAVSQPAPGGNIGQVQFWRSSTQSDATFISLSQFISNRHGNPQIFTAATQAVSWLNTNGYWTSYPTSSTLGTLANPAVSAQAIYNSGQTTDGWYWIKTSQMSTARQVYCNMTDQGGGWMLITYNPTNTVTTGNSYPNKWSYISGSFSSKLNVDVQDLWYNNGVYQCTQVMKMASTTASLTPLLAGMEIANKVVYNNPGNLIISRTFSSTQSAVTVNNTPMGGSWSAVKGHTLMTGPLNVNAPGDWIYLAGSTWWTVCGPSTAYPDSQGRSGNAQGSGSWTNISSNAIYGMANVATTTSSLRSDIKTYAVYIK